MIVRTDRLLVDDLDKNLTKIIQGEGRIMFIIPETFSQHGARSSDELRVKYYLVVYTYPPFLNQE